VLTAFRNVADSLAALEQDNQALNFADTASRTSMSAFTDSAARARLGAIPPSAARANERQYRNARLSAIRYESARLSDTASLFQAMGSPNGGTANVAATEKTAATAK
jgi:outer membrane protein TolC